MKIYRYKINDNQYEVSIDSINETTASVTVNEVEYKVEIQKAVSTIKTNTKPSTTPAETSPEVRAAVAKPVVQSGGVLVKSPLPGVVLSLSVGEGQQVKAGQRLLVLEAMKMENNIDAERDGKVKEIKVSKGDSVLEGDVLLILE